MQQLLKQLSPAIFGIVIICFLFPWVNFSCQGQHVATFTGLELVIGAAIPQQSMLGQNLNEKRLQELQRKVENGKMTQQQADRMANESPKTDSEPLAIAILLCTLAGLVFSFFKNKKSSLIPSIVGALAFILLLLLKSKIETDATSQGGGMIQVEYAIGFWMVLISFIVAVALNGYLYFASKKQVQVTKPQS